MNVQKRDGTLQEFDKRKLRTSIEKAGASSVDAINIAFRIGARVKEGTTTSEIRKGVSIELMALNQEAAQKYNARKPKIATR